MIGFGPAHRYFLYRPPADMRKGFDGLSGLVRRGLKRDPLPTHRRWVEATCSSS